MPGAPETVLSLLKVIDSESWLRWATHKSPFPIGVRAHPVGRGRAVSSRKGGKAPSHRRPVGTAGK